jgi:hypothetical protein
LIKTNQKPQIKIEKQKNGGALAAPFTLSLTYEQISLAACFPSLSHNLQPFLCVSIGFLLH